MTVCGNSGKKGRSRCRRETYKEVVVPCPSHGCGILCGIMCMRMRSLLRDSGLRRCNRLRGKVSCTGGAGKCADGGDPIG